MKQVLVNIGYFVGLISMTLTSPFYGILLAVMGNVLVNLAVKKDVYYG